MSKAGGVFLGYLHPNEISASFSRSLMDLITFDRQNSNHLRSWGAVRAAGYGLPEARNTVAQQVLDSECEWFLSVDADGGFAPWVLDQLLLIAEENQLPIVGGLAFAWREAGFDGMNGLRHYPLPTIYEYTFDEESGHNDFRGRAHYPVNQLVPSAATGCHLVLIHRTVLEQVEEQYGKVWFDRLPHPSKGQPYGEDMSFFIRTASLGIPCHVHTGVRSNHHKAVWVSETDFWDSFYAPPATEPVDVIVPTVRARAKNLPALAQSLKASTGLARLVLVLDDADHAIELEELGVRTAGAVLQPGSFARKINAAYQDLTGREDPAPWIQVVGDDCRFHPGWLDQQQLVARMYGAAVIGSNDMANPRVVRGEHATHWMISRSYIDEYGASWDGPGIVAHEGYRHWYVDDEIVTKAKLVGGFQMALGARIEHLHPITGKVETDEVYEKNDRYATQDRQLFEKRRRAHVDG